MKIAFDVDVLSKQMSINDLVHQVADWGYKWIEQSPHPRINPFYKHPLFSEECEVVCLLTFTMINNLIYSIMLNNGQAATLTAKLTDAQAASMETAFAQLSSTAPYMFLMGIVERGAAVIVQISLSVLVWFAVKEGGKKLWLYALAIVLHLVLDMASVVLNNYLPGAVIVTELIIWIVAIAYAFLARWVWKRNARPAPLMEANPSL